MLAFFANITPHGKGENLIEVKDSIGNITYQKEIEKWNRTKKSFAKKHRRF